MPTGTTTDDLASLVVSVSADITKLQKDMAKISGVTATAARDTENAWVKANDNIAGSTNRAMQQVQRSTRATQAQTANVAAQFQDIAIQLQSGTSPLTVALQQGSQLGAVFQQAAQQGGSAIATLFGAFRGLLSLTTLAPIAIIAIGGALVQAFSGGSKSIEDTIKDLKDLKDIAEQTGATDLKIRVGAELDEAQAKQVADRLQELIDERFASLGGGKSAIARFVNGIKDVLDIKVINLDPKPIDNVAAAVNTLINSANNSARAQDQVKQLGDALDELTNGRIAKDADRMTKALDQLSQLDLSGLNGEDLEGFNAVLKEASPLIADQIKQIREYQEAHKNAAGATDGSKEKLKEFNSAIKQLESLGAPAINKTTQAMLAYNAAVAAAGGDTRKLVDAQAALNVAIAGINKEAFSGIGEELNSATSSADKFALIVGGIEGTGKNPGSTAKGHFQFIASTWLQYARDMGFAAGKTSEEILKLRDNADVARAVFDQFTKDNVAGLRAQGIEANNLNKYLAHFLGLGDAIKLLKAPGGAIIDNVISAEAIRRNKEFLQTGSTVAQTIARINKSVEARRQKFDPTGFEEAITTSKEYVAQTKEEIAISQDASLNDAQRAASIAALRLEKDLLKDATKGGRDADAEQLAAIKQETQARYDLVLAQEQEKINKNNLKIMNGLLKDSTKDLSKEVDAQAQQFAQFGTSFITTFTSGLRQGKSAVDSLKDALVSLADQLLSMALNAALKSLFTSIFPQGVGLAGGLATGGPAGTGQKRYVSNMAFANAPRMATGGFVGVKPNEFPTILHRGEVVIPANLVKQAMGQGTGQAQTTNVSVGDVSVSTNLQGSGDVQSDTARGRAVGLQIEAAVRQILQKESRPGGALTAVGSGFRVGR